nr:hypothetical protein [Moorena producens]
MNAIPCCSGVRDQGLASLGRGRNAIDLGLGQKATLREWAMLRERSRYGNAKAAVLRINTFR